MLNQYGKLKKIPAYYGCKGCVYANDSTCPADVTGVSFKIDTNACKDNDTQIIFVPDK